MSDQEDLRGESTSRDLVQKLLPTCQRCRKLRRKCDTNLPDCKNCQKAHVECMFYDHALQQSVPRSYVQSLLTRLQSLESAKALSESSSHVKIESSTNPRAFLDPIISEETSVGDDRGPVPIVSTQHPPILDISESSSATSFDKHFPMPNLEKEPRFFGSSSVFTLSVHILQHAIKQQIIVDTPSLNPLTDLSLPYDFSDIGRPNVAFETQESIRSLCTSFLGSSNSLYGIVDEVALENDISTFLTLRNNIPSMPNDLHGAEAHQYFRVGMICAVSCATKARYHSELYAKSLAFYEDVLPYVEEVTSEVSGASLQALLLLTLFCLFWPGKGDIWKLLDYACRLAIELGYHTEQASDLEPENNRRLKRSTFWGLYTIERIVGQLFGRCSDLPETIITTEYPHYLSSDDPNGVASHPTTIAHHHRLVFLRSEIFKDLYEPAEVPAFDLEWFKERWWTLHSWRCEQQLGAFPGIFSATGTVGYHSSVIFVFQPFILQTLKAIETHVASPTTVIVPQEGYWSACDMLRMYEEIIRAPENSPLGRYPITFLSAHYIYLAGLTLMAHALLAIDGRTMTLRRIAELGDENEVERMDFSGLLSASSTCLILLSWCSERWPGMVGMVGVYKRLADQVIPVMIRRQIL